MTKTKTKVRLIDDRSKPELGGALPDAETLQSDQLEDAELTLDLAEIFSRLRAGQVLSPDENTSFFCVVAAVEGAELGNSCADMFCKRLRDHVHPTSPLEISKYTTRRWRLITTIQNKLSLER